MGGNAFFAAHWGGELCVYVHDGKPYATASGSRGYGYDLSGGVSLAVVRTPNMSDLCGHATYASGSVGPVTGGITYTDDGRVLTTETGVGRGVLPVSGSYGATYGWHVWQFGGKGVDDICNN